MFRLPSDERRRKKLRPRQRDQVPIFRPLPPIAAQSQKRSGAKPGATIWKDSDYANRLPRGRTYVRNGSVIDLKIAEGEIQAQVMGSSLYRVAVKVTAVLVRQWQVIGTDCAGSIDSLVELLQGKLSSAVMHRICTPRTGLFPSPK
jgi:uncharacterized Zn finger protein